MTGRRGRTRREGEVQTREARVGGTSCGVRGGTLWCSVREGPRGRGWTRPEGGRCCGATREGDDNEGGGGAAARRRLEQRAVAVLWRGGVGEEEVGKVMALRIVNSYEGFIRIHRCGLRIHMKDSYRLTIHIILTDFCQSV